MVTSKRGRLSSSDREKIHALSERGLSVADIAREVERREDVIEMILGTKRAPSRGRKGPMKAGKAGANGVANEVSVRRERPRGLLSHLLWVRPGFQIELNLPADLTEGEAERLSIMIKALPFA